METARLSCWLVWRRRSVPVRGRGSGLLGQVGGSIAGGGEAAAARNASALRDLLRNRAERAVFLRRRSTWSTSVPMTGWRCRASLAGLGIASGGVIEGYVRRADLGQVVEEYLLVRAQESGGNVFFHVVDEDGPLGWELVCGVLENWLVVAADLAEHRRPREEARALELVAGAAARAAR